MTIRSVPLDSQTEQKHRQLLAQAINELIKSYPREGSWTPVVRGSGTAGTYELASNTSRYTRIGRRVFIDIGIEFAAVITGGGTSDLQITGIPFEKAAGTFPVGSAALSGIDWAGGASLSISFNTTGASSALYVRHTLDNTTWSVVPISSVAASDAIYGSISYETDDV